ncbi:MAG: hypothetical protein CSA22_00500 [Deltaproteobacteria bacterium]|nr:MAG: hypothetical protein CSA22_00500 [Deltaproteobacteria bacterium]
MAPGKSHTPVRTSWNFLKELNGTSPLENLEHTILGSGIEIITSDMVADRSCVSFLSHRRACTYYFFFQPGGARLR